MCEGCKSEWCKIYNFCFGDKKETVKMAEIIRPTGICTICWENSTKGSKYNDVCDKCLPLTKSPKENENGQSKDF